MRMSPVFYSRNESRSLNEQTKFTHQWLPQAGTKSTEKILNEYLLVFHNLAGDKIQGAKVQICV